MGLGETADHPVVFAQLGGAWRIAVQTGVVGGGLVAIFVPNSPNPMSGSVFLVAADSVPQPRFHSLRLLAASGVAALGRKRFSASSRRAYRQREGDKACLSKSLGGHIPVTWAY